MTSPRTKNDARCRINRVMYSLTTTQRCMPTLIKVAILEVIGLCTDGGDPWGQCAQAGFDFFDVGGRDASCKLEKDCQCAEGRKAPSARYTTRRFQCWYEHTDVVNSSQRTPETEKWFAR